MDRGSVRKLNIDSITLFCLNPRTTKIQFSRTSRRGRGDHRKKGEGTGARDGKGHVLVVNRDAFRSSARRAFPRLRCNQARAASLGNKNSFESALALVSESRSLVEYTRVSSLFSLVETNTVSTQS